MKAPVKILIVAALALAVVGAVALKHGQAPSTTEPLAPTVAVVDQADTTATDAAPAATVRLPRLVDLGADKCIPCKMMAPILAEFQRDYADRFTTEFIDVWKNPAAGAQYDIRVIPTQIFYDAEGKERFRHEGFYGREDMLAKWKELGVDLTPKASVPAKN